MVDSLSASFYQTPMIHLDFLRRCSLRARAIDAYEVKPTDETYKAMRDADRAVLEAMGDLEVLEDAPA
jgi:hypothetical protein